MEGKPGSGPLLGWRPPGRYGRGEELKPLKRERAPAIVLTHDPTREDVRHSPPPPPPTTISPHPLFTRRSRFVRR
ncbi:hypothetical protein J6590_063724 [Homalodisca vitripennis]|nr:hypothetical protein J6590_063724 [Homalodisca vitripennis]